MNKSMSAQEIADSPLFKEVYFSDSFQNLLNSMVGSLNLSEKEPEEVRTILEKAINASADFFSNYVQEIVAEALTQEEAPPVKTVKAHHVESYDVEEHEVQIDESTPENESSVVLENQQRIQELEQEKAALEEQRQELSEENTELKNQNSSQTSHWPSSKERYPQEKTYQNGKTRAHETEQVERPPGGVPGHPGQQAVLTDNVRVEERILCYPDGWDSKQIQSHDWEEGAVHSIVSVKLQPSVKQYVQMQTRVPDKRSKKRLKVVEGQFPKEAQAVLSYGPALKRQVVIDSVVGLVSMGRISQILRDTLGITISRSSVCNILDSCSENLLEASQKIARQLKKEGEDENAIFYLDETGIDVNGKNFWDHVVVSDDYVHHELNASRGLKGMLASGIMENFKGTVSSDFWRNYINKEFDNCFCWSHLERELAAAAKRDPDSEWIKLMRQFAKESYLAYIEAKDKNSQIPEEKLEELLELYHQAIEAGWKEGPNGMSKKSWALFKRFKNYEEGITAHIIDTRLPRTNNDAERPLRLLKKKLDISGVFRTEKGAETFLAFRTVIDSANKQGINPFYALDQVLGGNRGFLVTHEADSALESKTIQIMQVETKDPS